MSGGVGLSTSKTPSVHFRIGVVGHRHDGVPQHSADRPAPGTSRADGLETNGRDAHASFLAGGETPSSEPFLKALKSNLISLIAYRVAAPISLAADVLC